MHQLSVEDTKCLFILDGRRVVYQHPAQNSQLGLTFRMRALKIRNGWEQPTGVHTWVHKMSQQSQDCHVLFCDNFSVILSGLSVLSVVYFKYLFLVLCNGLMHFPPVIYIHIANIHTTALFIDTLNRTHSYAWKTY